jgi:hypothetical protein
MSVCKEQNCSSYAENVLDNTEQNYSPGIKKSRRGVGRRLTERKWGRGGGNIINVNTIKYEG